MFGYKCTLFTDTEVITYILDLLVRKHKLPKRIACRVLSSSFWKDIDKMDEDEKELINTIRI